jgi:ADP-ribosylglycohydrolase
MGAILGARAGFKELPPQLIQGLYPQQELAQEIDDFVHAVLDSKGHSDSDQKVKQ